MLGTLIIRLDGCNSLEDFAKTICKILHVASYSERDSVNYPGDHYFIADILGITMYLTYADDPKFPEYLFQLNFYAVIDSVDLDVNCLDGLADLIAKYLADTNMDIIRPLDFGKIDSDDNVFYPRISKKA